MREHRGISHRKVLHLSRGTLHICSEIWKEDMCKKIESSKAAKSKRVQLYNSYLSLYLKRSFEASLESRGASNEHLN